VDPASLDGDEQLPGATEGYTQATFCILEEDHTLGNLLRWMLMKKCAPSLVRSFQADEADSRPRNSPSVEFCGYRCVQEGLSSGWMGRR
jgi:DNA-directed RNA polymerase I and III subunit RPAC2